MSKVAMFKNAKGAQVKHLWLLFAGDEERDFGEILDLNEVSNTELRAAVISWLHGGLFNKYVVKGEHGISLIEVRGDFEIRNRNGKVLEQH